MPQPVLLLGIDDSPDYSEFPLAEIAQARPVILADANAPAWARPYLARHLVVDPADAVATAAAVKGYATAHELGGVFTYTSKHLVTTAQIATKLELFGSSAEAHAVCTDRLQVRQRLAQHKVSMPRWAEARTPEAVVAQGDLIGYPVVIKSRIGGGSSGQACDRAEVPAIHARVTGLQAAQPHRHDTLLIEELVDGPQVAVETVALKDGDIQVVAITRTILGPPPARAAVRHCVYAHDSLLHNRQIRQAATRAVNALGITLGTLHIEMTLTSRGPCVTDVSAHLAGDLIPLLVKRATGINLPQVAADLATGQPPNLTPTRQRAAAAHFAYPAVSGRIESLLLTTSPHQPHMDRVALTQHAGHHVMRAQEASAEDRLAHWVVLGDTAADCHTALDLLAQDLTVHIVSSAAAVHHVGTPGPGSPRPTVQVHEPRPLPEAAQ
ncbi:ATP-grasp domain-containing protein [Streptomyces afghaniensis]|uniref:ATP-grasp domain-containing protein n=1 Tax=Streptomyces afghaniensis TaxID=66865 RepID=UPI0033B83F68